MDVALDLLTDSKIGSSLVAAAGYLVIAQRTVE